jgi:hypothetical protein
MLWGEVGLVRSIHSLPKTLCKVLSPSQNLLCMRTEIKNPQKRINQTIMVSTRSSDYATISGGGNGIGGESQLSRLLARRPPPRGKEKKDNNSTPAAFDVDDGDGGKVEVNVECKGDGNNDGPVDNNNDNNYDVGNHDDDDDNDRSTNMGRLWRSGRRWR